MKRKEYSKGEILNNKVFLFEISPYVSPSGRELRRAVFKCYCGKEWSANISDITTGHIKSCGCLFNKGNTKHGLKKHPLYTHWRGMRQRCNDSNHHKYKNYGGRGIKVCKEWNEDFLPFYKWAIENGYSKGLSIDRINNDGGYNPSNCRWITVAENSRHKSTIRINEKIIKEIKEARKRKPILSYKKIGELFGFSES